jgi:hypothetical protein
MDLAESLAVHIGDKQNNNKNEEMAHAVLQSYIKTSDKIVGAAAGIGLCSPFIYFLRSKKTNLRIPLICTALITGNISVLYANHMLKVNQYNV